MCIELQTVPRPKFEAKHATVTFE